MKYFLPFILLAFSATAWSKTITVKISDDDEKSDYSWRCTLKPFTEKYEASGQSKTQATHRVQKKCEKENNEMHCRDVKCEGANDDSKSWVCKVSAFTDTFEAIENGKAAAKNKAVQKCEKKHDEMHCKNVECATED